MRNCPSAVASATTVAASTSDGVDLTITSPDLDARREIIRLAAFHSSLGEPLSFVPTHSGAHGGPGTNGYCPIIHNGTTVSYQEIPGGVRIHVAARSRDVVELLQRATEARLAALSKPAI